MDWELGVNRCKLLPLEWISNEMLLWERSLVFFLLAASSNKSFLLPFFGLVVSSTLRQTQFSDNMLTPL